MRKRSYKIPLIISCLGLSSLLLFTYLTFIPNTTFAVTMPDPGELRTLSQIDTMQQMSQQICINSREHETKQLKDNRDDKLYWVTKLKDGNCWMTQNLDFDGDDTQKLTNQQDISKWDGSTVTNTTAAYYDPDLEDIVKKVGKVYYYTGKNYGYTDSACASNSTGLSACPDQFTPAVPDVSAPEGREKEHYRVGNYYSWAAATAGSTNTSNTSGDADASICPTGWKLPTSNSKSNGSFYYMLHEYGMASDINSGVLPGTGDKNIYEPPLYLFHDGTLFSGKLNNAGTLGYYWSSTIYDDTYTYHLHFYSGSTHSSSTHRRHYGMSVRCLSMGGWLDSYADPNDQANVAIVVAPVISIDVTKHADKMETDFTHVATDTITARVGSNLPYQVLISTEKSELTLSNDKKEDATEGVVATADTPAPSIPMLQKAGKIEAGTSSWGIKKLASINDTNVDKDTTYSPVGIEPEKVVFYTSNSAATDILNFPVAIAISSTIPFGTYSTQVTLTAMVN